MPSKSKKSLTRSTVIYAAFAGLLAWLIYFNEFRLGDLGAFLPMSEQMASTSLDVILLPLLISGSIFYVASLVGTAFEGTFAEVLVGTLYAAGFTSFFALFLIILPGSMNINMAGYLLSGAFGVVLLYNIVSTVARLKKKPSIRAAAISATIYAEGQIVVRLISLLIKSSGATMQPEMIDAVGQFIDLGVTIAAVFTLFAMFKTSKNPYLAALGGISGNYLFSVSLSLIGALYYGFFMGGLSALAPSIRNLSPYVEWTGICVFAALIFTVMRRGMQGSIIVRDRLGQWKRHLQQITSYKGDRFVDFTRVVDDFVQRGERERLLVKLALYLDENQVADEEISRLLSDLINYEDERKPAISRHGRTSKIEEDNMEKRLEVLQRTIGKIAPAGVTRASIPQQGTGGLAGQPSLRDQSDE
ncbi:MAG: YIP1 family protein [Candidatus Bathyarchaeota archaeon]|nr:YIP1 family protein [Candidatus Bathyarchaeota archaeon]